MLSADRFEDVVATVQADVDKMARVRRTLRRYRRRSAGAVAVALGAIALTACGGGYPPACEEAPLKKTHACQEAREHKAGK